jgi:hypothetical protein
VSYAFDSAIAVRRTADGVYGAEVHDGWDIMGNANGGYAMALIAHAMRAECEHAALPCAVATRAGDDYRRSG